MLKQEMNLQKYQTVTVIAINSDAAPRGMQLRYVFSDLSARHKYGAEPLALTAKDVQLLEAAQNSQNYNGRSYNFLKAACVHYSEHSDGVHLGRIQNQANEIENEDMESFLKTSYESLSESAKNLVESMLISYGANAQTKTISIDYEALGRDHPAHVIEGFRGMCGRLDATYAAISGGPTIHPIRMAKAKGKVPSSDEDA